MQVHMPCTSGLCVLESNSSHAILRMALLMRSQSLATSSNRTHVVSPWSQKLIRKLKTIRHKAFRVSWPCLLTPWPLSLVHECR